MYTILGAQIAALEAPDAAICNCFGAAVLGISIGANMQATLCVDTLDNAMMAYPDPNGAIIHSDRGLTIHQPDLSRQYC